MASSSSTELPHRDTGADAARRDLARRATWLIAFNALLLGWTVLRPAPHRVFVAVCDLAYVVGPLLGFLWCLPRPTSRTGDLAHRADGDHHRLRRDGGAAWLCLALGPVAFAGGSVVWAYYEIVRGQSCPFPSWADAGFLAAYPFLLAGVLLTPRRPRSALFRGRVLVDCLTVTAALATFSWFFVLGPIVVRAGAGTWGLTLLGAGYPAFDLLLLFCALLLASEDADAARRPSVRLLCAGLVSIAVVDTVFAYQTSRGTYVTGRPIDVLWTLGYMLVGLGARELRLAGAADGRSGAPAAAPAENAVGGTRASGLRTLLPYLLILPVGMLLLEVYRTHAGGPVAYGVYLGSAAVVVLTLARQALATAENARLARDLRAACRKMETAHRQLGQAHATLLRSEELFRVASRCASDLIFEWDVATGRVQWYGDIDAQLGYCAGEFPRTLAAWQAAVHPDDAARVAEALERLRHDGGGTFCEEYRVRRRDGSWCHWIGRGVWLRSRRPGGAARMVGTVTDVTDRRQAEQELRATEGRLRRQNAALVELARRQNGAPTDLAAAFAAVTEVAARTLEVERCSIWLLNEDRSAIRCLDLFERAPARHSAGVELAAAQFPAYFAALDDDRTIVAHDAHTDSRTCEFSASYLAPLGITSMLDAPVRVGGRTVGVVCHEHVGPPRQWTMEEQHFADCMTNLVSVAIEADHRRRAQEALHAGELANERLARERGALKDAVAAMEQVLGVVGHELRTPLAGLRAMSEFLLTDGAREASEAEAFLAGIRDEVVRMSGTVNDLLEAARLNSGLARWNWAEVSLAEACAGAMGSVRPLVNPSRVRLECLVEPDNLAMRGDAEAMRRLVLNLLSNAVRHTRDGHVQVTARPSSAPDGAPGEWVEITVVDTGAGIAPEIVARLGEAFALNSGIVGANYVSGAGLGLAICKGIIHAHGGSMRVASAQGRGTTVTVRLRRDLPAPAAGAGKAHINRYTATAGADVS